MESVDSAVLRGNCDIDVDECASSPCQNGATCTESYSELGLERRSVFSKVSIEQTSTGWVNGGNSYTTFVLAVSLTEGAQNVHTIFGDADDPLRMPAAYQAPDGVDIGGVPTEGQSASALHDSWLTVGLMQGSQYDAVDEIRFDNIDFAQWGDAGLLVSNGSVSWNSPDHAPGGDHVAIAQLTVEDGQQFTASVNMRGQSTNTSAEDWSGKNSTRVQNDRFLTSVLVVLQNGASCSATYQTHRYPTMRTSARVWLASRTVYASTTSSASTRRSAR